MTVAAGEAVEHRQRHVGPHREVEVAAFGLAVLGHECETGGDRQAGVPERSTVAAHVETPGGPAQAEQTFQQDRLTLSLETGEPAHLAGVHDEARCR